MICRVRRSINFYVEPGNLNCGFLNKQHLVHTTWKYIQNLIKLWARQICKINRDRVVKWQVLGTTDFLEWLRRLSTSSCISVVKIVLRSRVEKLKSAASQPPLRCCDFISSENKNVSHFTSSNYRVTISYIFTHQGATQANHSRIWSHPI